MNIEITASPNHLPALDKAIDALVMHTIDLRGTQRERFRLAIQDLDNLRDMIRHGLEVTGQLAPPCGPTTQPPQPSPSRTAECSPGISSGSGNPFNQAKTHQRGTPDGVPWPGRNR